MTQQIITLVTNIVYNQDCNIEMKKFPDKHFDLAVVDPPYYSGPEKRQYYGNKMSPINVKRIDYPIINKWQVPNKEYFDELFRISKHQIIWGCNYFDYHFGPGRIVWDKVNNKNSFSDCEIAFCSKHNSTRLFRYMWNGMMQGKNITEGHIMQGNKKLNEKRIHPTQKPVNLYLWILSKYAEKNYLILDTHVGSGSSRIAANILNLPFIGFEINQTYFMNQESRYKNFTQQRKLINEIF